VSVRYVLFIQTSGGDLVGVTFPSPEEARKWAEFAKQHAGVIPIGVAVGKSREQVLEDHRRRTRTSRPKR
jgi:hypothetical protein